VTAGRALRRARVRPRIRPALLAALIPLLWAASACSRENRDFDATSAPSTAFVPSGHLQAGGPTATRPDTLPPPADRPPPDSAATGPYDENRWAVSEGQTLYERMNCSGCHAAYGGGGMGPALRDSLWIYGSDADAVFQTIQQGRPDGMPSFGNRLAPPEIWKITAYVRSLARLTPRDTWVSRPDDLSRKSPRRADKPEP
jgi:cytochrome c oxidase cbb3-type subunit III